MKSEPTLILEVIRLVALLAGMFGVVITVEEQTIIAGGIVALVSLVSLGIAIWNRRSVFSPDTAEKLVASAAATGDPTIGKPPAG